MTVETERLFVAIESFTRTRWVTLERGGRLYPF
jgi:hypothetical protein